MFFKEEVWKSLKLLDILLEESGYKEEKIRKLFKQKCSVSQMVYNPWSEIVYLKTDKPGKYMIGLEGNKIVFGTGFTGTLKEFKLIVDRAWDVCSKDNRKFITSKEMPEILEFPNFINLEEGMSYGLDAVVYGHEGAREITVVGIDAIRKVKGVLDILNDDDKFKIRRINSFMKGELKNGASAETYCEMILNCI